MTPAAPPQSPHGFPLPIAFASTRVIGSPHVGTFYGWIKPLQELAHTHRLTLLLCDKQSFDGKSLPNRESIEQFRSLLRTLIPQAMIAVESEIRGLDALVPLLIRISSPRPLVRNPTLRSLASRGALTLGHLVYPLLMAADLLAVDPSTIAVSAGRYGYHEYPLALMNALRRRVGLEVRKVGVKRLPPVTIVDDAGNRLRRVTARHVLDASEEQESLRHWLLRLRVPSEGPASERWDDCRAPRSIWAQVQNGSPLCSDPASTECDGCLGRLSTAIRNDLLRHRQAFSEPISDINGLPDYSKRVYAVLERWIPSDKSYSSTTRAPLVAAFIPEDVADLELTAWLVLCLARTAMVRANLEDIALDVVLLPPNARGADPNDRFSSLPVQVIQLQSVAARYRIQCRITTFASVLDRSSGLLERLYLHDAGHDLDNAVSGLAMNLDRHILELLQATYAPATCMHFVAFAADYTWKMEVNPPMLDGHRLIAPVAAGRSSLEESIRRYPTHSLMTAELPIQAIYALSSAWTRSEAEMAEATSYTGLKAAIVQTYNRIWRTR